MAPSYIVRNEGEVQLEEQAHFFSLTVGTKKKKQTLSYNKVSVKILKQVNLGLSLETPPGYHYPHSSSWENSQVRLSRPQRSLLKWP